jgi:hypothetical protein
MGGDNTPGVSIDYRLFKQGERWAVHDVVHEGASLVAMMSVDRCLSCKLGLLDGGTGIATRVAARRAIERSARPAASRLVGGAAAAAANYKRVPAPEYPLDLGPLGVRMPPGYGHRVQGNVVALGPVPAQEVPARPGDSDYAARAFAQCQRFIGLLRRRLGPEPAGARFGVRRSEQEFDPYLEVVMRYDDGNAAARAYAARCDRDAPARWDT